MNKASKAFRRGSIRLKSFPSGHYDLNLIISDLKQVKATGKAFMEAQETAVKDIARWASKEQNKAIVGSYVHILNLQKLWTEAQMDFFDDLNKYKSQFDGILEAEQVLDGTKNRLVTLHEKEVKLTKDLKKNCLKRTTAEIGEIKEKIAETTQSIKTTKAEIAERIVENESMKAIRVKKGLSKMSEDNVNLAKKMEVIFTAQKLIAGRLPDAERMDRNGLHNIRQAGDEEAKCIVKKAEEKVKQLKLRHSPYRAEAPNSDSPPPYSSITSTNFSYSSPELQIFYSRPNHQYDLPPAESMDQDNLGAVGGVSGMRVSNL